MCALVRSNSENNKTQNFLCNKDNQIFRSFLGAKTMDNHFNEILDRTNTACEKWDSMAAHNMPEDTLPLWVADMDFRSPPNVLETLERRINHGVFGYSFPSENYLDTLQNWFKMRHNWDIQDKWLIITPGVVFAINTAIRALTGTGDSILIQQPVYPPFASSVLENGRKLVVNQLILENGQYKIDFEDFERQIIQQNVKMFILCSPHNPIGRVWTKEELLNMGDICLKHGVYVVSDEIHQDFIYKGHTHQVFASLKPEFALNSITCTAPSKTFNLAGLQTSNIFIPNKNTCEAFTKELVNTGFGCPNVLGMTACQAAYEGSAGWLDELTGYLWENISFTQSFLQEHTPKIHLVKPQGTYLLWLDCREMGLDNQELHDFFVNNARVWLNDGYSFGQGGDGFQRLNAGCPRSTLENALTRIYNAYQTIL